MLAQVIICTMENYSNLGKKKITIEQIQEASTTGGCVLVYILLFNQCLIVGLFCTLEGH